MLAALAVAVVCTVGVRHLWHDEAPVAALAPGGSEARAATAVRPADSAAASEEDPRFSAEFPPPSKRPRVSDDDSEDDPEPHVTYRNAFGLLGEEPNVVYERFGMGGIRVTSQIPGGRSMTAQYGMGMIQASVRQQGLNGEQLAAVARFEARFGPVVEGRLLALHSRIEEQAAGLSAALLAKDRGAIIACRQEMARLMREVGAENRTLYVEYLRGIGPALTAEQYEAVSTAFITPAATP